MKVVNQKVLLERTQNSSGRGRKAHLVMAISEEKIKNPSWVSFLISIFFFCFFH